MKQLQLKIQKSAHERSGVLGVSESGSCWAVVDGLAVDPLVIPNISFNVNTVDCGLDYGHRGAVGCGLWVVVFRL